MKVSKMDPRVTVITLGVSDLVKSREFYEKGLGWSVSLKSNESVCFFQLNNIIFALYPKKLLAEDANLSEDSKGFCGFSLAHNVANKEDVAKVLLDAERSGGTVVKQAQDVFWGGYHGYFCDPDRYLWEIAWNPHWVLDEDGSVKLSS